MALPYLYQTVPIISGSEIIAVWDPSNSDWRKLTISALATFSSSTSTGSFTDYTTQYSAPSATGFNVAITDGSANIHLILTPTAGYATGTITLPSIANVVDKQRVLVNCTQQVTTLTVNGNGATAVTGEPTSLAADDFFTLKYDAITDTWYRVG